jgi:pimeloyl-ACP methyl ester carboxylesterase
LLHAAALTVVAAGLVGASLAGAKAPATAAASSSAAPRALAAASTNARDILRAARQAERLPAPWLSRRLGIAATPCGQTPGLLCSDVVVPLDRSGQVPGSVALKVQTLPSPGTPRGVMFLVAGGPGQGSASVFGLGDPSNADYYRFLFPGYTLVAFDNRGTGGSGLLQCPGLQGYYPIEQEEARVGACAGAIGSPRGFYSTREHAEDVDAVRSALGAQKIGIWGTSYGTKLALAYALAHPDRVDRLLLDSMVPTDLDDPYRANSLREMPRALSDLCSTGLCRPATPDFAGDVVAVANRLAAKPVEGTVLQTNGKRRKVRLTGLDVMSLTIDADLNPGLAAELPAVMRAARNGDYQPILRMFQLDLLDGSYPAEALSGGLFAATVCNDGPFPWAADAPVAGRRAQWDAAVSALPAGALGPFGRWAAAVGNGHFCLGWPPPSGHVPLGTGPLPNVPVLAVNGGFDMRTPVASAQHVIAKFPQGRLLVVNGVGHSVLGADPSFCSSRAVRAWSQGASFDQCARPAPFVAPVPGYPAAKRRRQASPKETYAVAVRTVKEAQALWLMTGSPGQQVAGLYGGKVVMTGDREFTLVRYSLTPGIELSGKIRFVEFGPPLVFDGLLEVTGNLAATGLVGLSRGTVAGVLGGQLVG